MSLQFVQFTATSDDAADVESGIEKLSRTGDDAARSDEEERRS
jgi:hypothetical protein